MKAKFLTFLASLVFLVALFVYQFAFLQDNRLHLIFCDVGQGDGILIRTPKGVNIIVDGGPTENSMLDCLFRHLPFWDRTIEVVFMTHPDADHLTGLLGIIKSYNVKFFGMSDAPKTTGATAELMSLLEEKKIDKHSIFKDDILRTSDGVSIISMWPTREFVELKSNDTNEYSLTQEVTFGKLKILLTGDLPAIYLNQVMLPLKRLDVIKPPHHGSRTGIDESTFRNISPQQAVISVGANNRYGHPSASVLKILKDFHIGIKDTMKGDVEIISDGKKWWMR